MKIRLAVIPVQDLTRARAIVDALRSAVNAGDMDKVDAATGELTALTHGYSAIDLSEDEWREFLLETRGKNPAFSSDYLLPGQVCSAFFPNMKTETVVLQLPIDEEGGGDV